MLVFIDESGDPGFKLEKGSTPQFVVAMVVFEDPAVAALVDQAIENVRIQVRHKAEFKFSKCRYEVRDAFCQAVTKFDFIIRAIVVKKERIYSEALRSRTETFYNFFVRMMMEHDGDLLSDAIVKIDESGDRKFKRQLSRYLRGQIGNHRIKKVRFVNSRGNNLVQLADMAAGAIHRCHRSDRQDNDRWSNQLNARIGDIWTFPNAGY